jgi:two-component system response regulator AtoC
MKDKAASEAAATVLVVDDDRSVRTVLAASLQREGMQVREASSGDEALAAIASGPVDLVLTDLRMPGMDGMRLLHEVTARWGDVPVIVLTAHGTVALAVEAMKSGASDFILKPFDRDEILYAVKKALLQGQYAEECASSGSPPARAATESPAMREVYELIDRVAHGTATVLLRGESGTGKGLAARAIHDRGPRKGGPFVKLHCAALPEALLESELFGYEKGAFTGAACRKPGRVELAQGGTLFLDEIGDISPSTQVKLLRVLQEKEFERLGGTETIRADVRFVAATHKDLEAMVGKGEFREDLLYRLSIIPIRLPSLRERVEEIGGLVLEFCKQFGPPNGKPNVSIDVGSIEVLRAEPWPGNVRQLQNFVERLIVLSDGERLGAGDVRRELARTLGVPPAPVSDPVASSKRTPEPSSKGTLEARRREADRRTLKEALQKAGGNRALAARLLGVSRRTLYYKLAELEAG